MTTANKTGIALIVIGIAIYFIFPQVYRWVPGAMWGAGLALALFFGPKKVKD